MDFEGMEGLAKVASVVLAAHEQPLVLHFDWAITPLEVPLTLQSLHDAVGGYIEVVTLSLGTSALVLVVNEAGRLLDLELNPLASRIAGRVIVGNAVLTARHLLD